MSPKNTTYQEYTTVMSPRLPSPSHSRTPPSWLRPSERPSKLRKVSHTGSITLRPACASQEDNAFGTQMNPIVLNDDEETEFEDNRHALPYNLDTNDMKERPAFLLLRDLLLYSLDNLTPGLSRERIFYYCCFWGHKSDDNIEKLFHRIIESVCASRDFPLELDGSIASSSPNVLPDVAAQWKDNWQNFSDPEVYASVACDMLVAIFPRYPSTYIKYMFISKGCLFLAYAALQIQAKQGKQAPEWENKPCPILSQKLTVADHGRSLLENELESAITATEQFARSTDSSQEQFQAAEAPSNLDASAFLECHCCSADAGLDEIVYCSGELSHSFCHTCMQSYVNSLIGDAKYLPVCFALGSDCRATISNEQLRRCLLPSTLDLLLDRQLQDHVKEMDLHLEACPFCDYVEEIDHDYTERNFICRKPVCQKVSCRACREDAHSPKTCDQARAEGGGKYLHQRHAMEEAMTDALVRKCNKCKTPFIKTGGCNKITCTRCQNKQCYICGKNVTDYTHFDGGCVLHDGESVEARHMQDVETAKTKAIGKIRLENPLISSADLGIHVSAVVAEAETGLKQSLELMHKMKGRNAEPLEGQIVVKTLPLPTQMFPRAGQVVGYRVDRAGLAVGRPATEYLPAATEASLQGPRIGAELIPKPAAHAAYDSRQPADPRHRPVISTTSSQKLLGLHHDPPAPEQRDYSSRPRLSTQRQRKESYQPPPRPCK